MFSGELKNKTGARVHCLGLSVVVNRLLSTLAFLAIIHTTIGYGRLSDEYVGLGAWNVRYCSFPSATTANVTFWSGETVTALFDTVTGWKLPLNGWTYQASYRTEAEARSNMPVQMKRISPTGKTESLVLYDGSNSVAYFSYDRETWAWLEADGIIRNLYGRYGIYYSSPKPVLKEFTSVVVFGKITEVVDKRLDTYRDACTQDIWVPFGYWHYNQPNEWFYLVIHCQKPSGDLK